MLGCANLSCSSSPSVTAEWVSHGHAVDPLVSVAVHLLKSWRRRLHWRLLHDFVLKQAPVGALHKLDDGNAVAAEKRERERGRKGERGREREGGLGDREEVS